MHTLLSYECSCCRVPRPSGPHANVACLRRSSEINARSRYFASILSRTAPCRCALIGTMFPSPGARLVCRACHLDISRMSIQKQRRVGGAHGVCRDNFPSESHSVRVFANSDMFLLSRGCSCFMEGTQHQTCVLQAKESGVPRNQTFVFCIFARQHRFEAATVKC